MHVHKKCRVGSMQQPRRTAGPQPRMRSTAPVKRSNCPVAMMARPAMPSWIQWRARGENCARADAGARSVLNYCRCNGWAGRGGTLAGDAGRPGRPLRRQKTPSSPPPPATRGAPPWRRPPHVARRAAPAGACPSVSLSRPYGAGRVPPGVRAAPRGAPRSGGPLARRRRRRVRRLTPPFRSRPGLSCGSGSETWKQGWRRA